MRRRQKFILIILLGLIKHKKGRAKFFLQFFFNAFGKWFCHLEDGKSLTHFFFCVFVFISPYHTLRTCVCKYQHYTHIFFLDSSKSNISHIPPPPLSSWRLNDDDGEKKSRTSINGRRCWVVFNIHTPQRHRHHHHRHRHASFFHSRRFTMLVCCFSTALAQRSPTIFNAVLLLCYELCVGVFPSLSFASSANFYTYSRSRRLII